MVAGVYVDGGCGGDDVAVVMFVVVVVFGDVGVVGLVMWVAIWCYRWCCYVCC